jgi:hypothetical protein
MGAITKKTESLSDAKPSLRTAEMEPYGEINQLLN